MNQMPPWLFALFRNQQQPILQGAPKTLPAAIMSHAIKKRMSPELTGPPTIQMPQVRRPRTPHLYY